MREKKKSSVELRTTFSSFLRRQESRGGGKMGCVPVLKSVPRPSSLVLLSLLVFLFGIFLFNGLYEPQEVQAAAITSAATGNWNTTTTWGGGVVPGAADDVTIANGHTVTIAAAPTNGTINSLTIATGNAATGVTWSDAYALAVTNAVTINLPSGNNITKQVAVGTGTLTAGSISITSGTGPTRISQVTLSTGTVTVSGSISFGGTATAARLVYTGTGNVNLTGNFGSGGTLTTLSGSIMNFNGSAAQQAASYTTYDVVKVNNTAGLTMTGTSTIATLTIGDVTANSVFSDGGYQVTSTGTLNLTSGTFKLGAGTATTFPGFATNNITAGTTVEYASTVAQTISGTPTYSNLTLSGASTKTLGAATVVNGNLTISAGTLDVSASNFGLTVKGNWTNNGTFTPQAGTVTFNGTGAQTINNANTWYGLAITGSTARTVSFQSSVAQTIAANGSLTLTGALGQLLTLAPLTAATTWLLNVNATGVTQSISYVSVSYSNASGGGTAVNASNGTNTNGGNNTNWNFGDGTPPTTSGLTFTSPVSGSYVGSPFNFTGSLTDNESNVTSCQYCVKNGAECTSADTWAAGSLSGSSPTWTCTASSVSLYTNGSGITSGDSVYIDVRGTSTGGQNDNGGTAISKTMDKTAPATTDNQTSSNWQATEKTVTLTPDDGTGSGVTAATGIYGCFGTLCSPSVLGSNSMTTACGAGNACTYDVRYYSVDNVGNTESTVTSSYQAKVDRAAPAAVADLAGPTSTTTSVDLTWANPSDGTGSGNASFDVRYRIGATFVEGDWAGASLATGEPTPPTTGMTVGSLTCGTTYTFAIKTTDNVSNISTISNAATKATSACPAGPSLSPPTETGYTDYKNPDSGSTTTDIRFKVIYQSSNAPTYVRVCIGDNDDSGSYPCYDMTADTSCAAPYCNSDYSDGEQFVYGPIRLGAAQDIRFYFEANDIGGTTKLPSDAPTSYYTGPAVYLLWTQNLVGVPKCVGGSCTAGLSYSSILGDDSGYSSYCYTYNSTGLYAGKYESCTSSSNAYTLGKVYTGKGYFIWASNANIYRLDEKNVYGTDLAGNVSAASFSIPLDKDGGWNLISNPYNKRIQLCNDAVCTDSGARVNVVRVSVNASCSETAELEEVNFDTAVKTVALGGKEWIGNTIYEWEGFDSGSVGHVYDEPAALKPWTGLWIYLKRACSPGVDHIKLKVYKE